MTSPNLLQLLQTQVFQQDIFRAWLANPVVAGAVGIVGGFLPLLAGSALPGVLKGWVDSRRRILSAISAGILFSFVFDVLKETSGLSASTLITSLDAANLLVFSSVFLFLYLSLSRHQEGESSTALRFAYSWVILGVGSHGAGEGLSIGHESVRGLIVLSGPQVASFVLHKAAEGFTIGTLLAKQRAKTTHYLSTSIIGGLPIGLGAVMAFFGSAPGITTVLFAAAGGAAIFFVSRFVTEGIRNAPKTSIWILAGFLYMFLAGVLHQFE